MAQRHPTLLAACSVTLLSGLTATGQSSPALQRHYQEGEPIAYTMHASNQGRTSTRHYEAVASGKVTNTKSIPFESLHWTRLEVEGKPVALSPESSNLQEDLSLAPAFRLSVPNLANVQPLLIGPITDLLTFYADVQLAMRQPALRKAGDHVYVKRDQANSWADGTYVTLGQDAVDFDLTLTSLDPKLDRATLIVRHVPPAHPAITLPAEWMRVPVAVKANNWVQVEHREGVYVAGVGEETFAATITLAPSTGRILAVSMDNPVEIVERECKDAALSDCGEPVRYRTHRQIVLEAIP